VNDTEGSSCRKLGPVHSLPKPFQIIAEEFIIRGALVHESIAESNGCMEYRVPALQTIPNLVEDTQIRVVVSVEKFEVQFDSLAAVKDLAYSVKSFVLAVGKLLLFWSWSASTIVQFTQELVTFGRYVKN
jgi:hypothetical protein